MRLTVKFARQSVDIVIYRTSKGRAMLAETIEPQDAGVKVPKHLIRDRFCAGFRHAMQGGQLKKVEHLRLSFREGYRAGKLYLRELRRSQGVLTFPVQGRMKLKTIS